MSDELGSVVAVVDVATGVVAQELVYDAWGRVQSDSAPGFQPFGFAGGIYDLDTGWVLFGARDYRPDVGAWAAKDPLGFAAGDSNLYRYVGGDPVNHLDPDGRAFLDSVRATCFRSPAMCMEAGLLGVGGGSAMMQRAAAAAPRMCMMGARAARAVVRGGPIRQAISQPGVLTQIRSSGAVHAQIDGGRTLVVSENHFNHSVNIFKVFKGTANLFRPSFWKHVLPHRHVYRLSAPPPALNANWRKTFEKLSAAKDTVWPWQ